MPLVEGLPDAFYRVSVKALVLNDERRLLVFRNPDGWEMPGGGWERTESLEACVTRELAEEVRASVAQVGDVAFCYRGTTFHGNPKLCLAVRVTLNDMQHFTPSGDDLLEARFVTRDEFLKLSFQKGEGGIQKCAHLIWPTIEKCAALD